MYTYKLHIYNVCTYILYIHNVYIYIYIYICTYIHIYMQVSFANKSDFISFRHHMYKKTGYKEVELKEVGPRFEMRLFQVTRLIYIYIHIHIHIHIHTYIHIYIHLCMCIRMCICMYIFSSKKKNGVEGSIVQRARFPLRNAPLSGGDTYVAVAAYVC
jgi:hypothetical protein